MIMKKENYNAVIKEQKKFIDESKEVVFLIESNKIEGEHSTEALEDAEHAWNFAKKHSHNFNLNYILLIHQELMRRLNPKIAGKIRECSVYIGGEKRNQPKEEIILQLNELVDLWNKNKDILKGKNKRKQDRENFIKRWHFLFELCHFAEDGNGRTGRILMNIQRLYFNLPLLIIHTGIEQKIYYTWFKRKRCYIWKYQSDKIIKDYNNGKGKTIGQIAEELNFNHQAISNLLKRNGIKVIIRYDNAPRGEKSGAWKGGIRHLGNGYKSFHKPEHHLARGDGWVLEHRAVMEKKLGRNLLKGEVVHHKDGNIENNDIDNLDIYKNNGEHRKEHSKKEKRDKKGRWIKEIK